MNTLDIEIAIIKAYHPRQNLIIPNVSWGIWDIYYKPLHECDVLILSNSGYATEIEIKVSKADLLKDASKRHKHSHNLIRRLYFAVPEKLKEIALTAIPENAGLIVVSLREVTNYHWHYGGGKTAYNDIITTVNTIKECKINSQAQKWDDKQRYQLARLGAMRILALKQKIQKKSIDGKRKPSLTSKEEREGK
jgi:hypothetical protein